jgi:archaellum component FlaG (FlaF/FlaG flagellin family)
LKLRGESGNVSLRQGDVGVSRSSEQSASAGEWRDASRLIFFIAALMTLLIGACATMSGTTQGLIQTPEQKAEQVVPMLQSAGFEPVTPTTPTQIAELKSLPPLKLGYYIDKDGDGNYWMADPDYCKCIMHGDEAAYQRYENLKLENETAEQDRRAMEYQQQQTNMMMAPPGMGYGFGNGSFGGFGGGGFGFSSGSFGMSF